MPSLKKVSTRRRRYGGSEKNHVLKRAINLLFQLKGTEYQKAHPEFAIPTADEFFGFVKLVDTDFTKHYRTTHTKRKATNYRQISPNKEFLLVTPQHGGNRLTDFLSFILKSAIGPHDTACERFFACCKIVFYAVMVYVFVEQSLLIYAESPMKSLMDIAKEVIAKPEFENSLADPIRWFFWNHLPSLVRSKDALKELGVEYLRRFLFPIIPSFMTSGAVTVESISQMVIMAVDSLLVNPRIFDNFFKRPIACYLWAEGFVSCKPICDALRGVPTADHAHVD